ncbi:MAG: lysophospholipid acyltransferase family protein [Dehalococcoidales bacterium]|nr:lysophospholipid acyltransferase family protein [Dehalococcoidales bacterium]
MILYYILEIMSFAARITPAFISYSIAGGVGNAAYRFWPRGRRNMSKSIAAVLCRETGSPEVQRNVLDGLRNYYKSNVDIFRYAHAGPGFFEKSVDLIGIDNLDKAFSAGRGVIIAGFHMGNLDLGVRALSHAGYPLNAIVQKFESGQIDRFIQGPRTRSGIKLIREDEDVFRMMEALRRNEAVALMIEGRCYEKGILAPLGKKHIRVPAGIAVMALKTGAKVVPCCLVRSANTRFHGIIGKPVEFNPAVNTDADIRELTRRTVRALGEMAALFADQWYIFHDLIIDDIGENERPD